MFRMSNLREEISSLEACEKCDGCVRKAHVLAIIDKYETHNRKVNEMSKLADEIKSLKKKCCQHECKDDRQCTRCNHFDYVLSLVEEKVAPQADNHGWVVERWIGNKLYFYAPGHIAEWAKSEGDFCANPDKAMRFSREADALSALYKLCNAQGRVAEHVWMEPAGVVK